MHMGSKELPLVFTSAKEKVYFYSYNSLIWVSFNIILFYFFFFLLAKTVLSYVGCQG